MYLADMVVCGSPLAYRLQCAAYAHPRQRHLRCKLWGNWDMAAVSRQDRPTIVGAPPHSRPHSRVACILSNTQRRIKHGSFVKTLFTHPHLRHWRKVVVGQHAHTLFSSTERQHHRIDVHDTQDNDTILRAILGQSDVLVVPSMYDCNPNVVQEALSVNTIPLVTRYVGWWWRYPKAWCVSPAYETTAWVRAMVTCRHASWCPRDYRRPLAHADPDFLTTWRAMQTHWRTLRDRGVRGTSSS